MGRFTEKVNTSPKQKKLKKALEELGHTNVEVWWENLESVMEMCGPEGGYFFCSDQDTFEPIGYSFNEAMEYIRTESYLKVNKEVPK